MTIQHIGQDFSSSYEISLLPGVELSTGFWQINATYTTDVGGTTTFSHVTYNTSHRYGLKVKVGRDVHSINVHIHNHNGFPKPMTVYKYYMRVDRLIMLNLVAKLLKRVGPNSL